MYWVRNPLQTITELCCGDLKDFYQDKIEGVKYTESEALRLLKVGFLGGLHRRCYCLEWRAPSLFHFALPATLHYIL